MRAHPKTAMLRGRLVRVRGCASGSSMHVLIIMPISILMHMVAIGTRIRHWRADGHGRPTLPGRARPGGGSYLAPRIPMHSGAGAGHSHVH